MTDPYVLSIPSSIQAKMVAHCLREAPREACGLLGGLGLDVSSFHPLRNTETREDRYNADPDDIIRAIQRLRGRRAEIAAIYHSHPRWIAEPSRTDLARNFYGSVPRIIVSLISDPPEVRVWRLDPDSFAEIPWRIVEDSPLPQA
ncbi:M67 family metallopeptidase [soil metagenome]